jgi:hypothetical protein
MTATTMLRNVTTNEGVTALEAITLPTAVQNLRRTYIVQDADGLSVTANTGDTIRIGSSVTAAAGAISSTTIGSSVTLLAINATEWVAERCIGVWSIAGNTITLTGAVPTEITVANEATDTTCFPLFSTAATGNLAPKSNANLTYNSNTGLLSSTSLAGTLVTASQTNITGLGTITTGTWNATDVAVAAGGTGASTAIEAARNLQGAYVLAQSAAAVASTNTTSEEVLATITIPANALGANGRIEVTVSWTHTNSANAKTMRMRYSGGGSTVLQTLSATTTASSSGRAGFSNRNATNSQVAISASSVGSYGSSANALVTFSVDTTASSSIVISSQKATGTETLTLESYSAIMYPKA